MTRVSVLSMTRLLAVMNAAVEGAIARIGASEHASPLLNNALAIFCAMLLVTCDLVTTIGTQQSLLDLATVAASVDTDFTSSTKAFMTWPRAFVLTTWHEVAADFTTTPAILVVGIGTTTGRLVLATETGLGRTHVCTRRARASMASQLTGVRAFANSFSAASIAAGVWRQASNSARLDLLLTPTSVCLWQCILRKIASRTSPLSGWRNLAILATLLLSSSRSLILGPLLDTAHVENSPACMA